MRIVSYSVTNLIPYGMPRACFGNARDYVDEVGGDMRYAEGLAYDLEERVVFHHAWAVDVHRRENYEVSQLDSDLLYFGYIVGTRRLRSRFPKGTFGAFFAFRRLAPITERIRQRHPVDKVYGASWKK
jgi:hypothetical protein